MDSDVCNTVSTTGKESEVTLSHVDNMELELMSQASIDSADDLLHDGLVYIDDFHNFTSGTIDILGELNYEAVNDSSEIEALKRRIFEESKPLDFLNSAEQLLLQQELTEATSDLESSLTHKLEFEEMNEPPEQFDLGNQPILDFNVADIDLKEDPLNYLHFCDIEKAYESTDIEELDEPSDMHNACSQISTADKVLLDVCWFEQLPAEVIQHIFSFLSFEDFEKTSLVSKQFYTHSNDPINWQRIDFSKMNREMEISLRKLEKLVCRSPLLKDIKCQGISCFPLPTLTILTQNCPLLQKLDLSFVDDLCEAHFALIAENCHNLRWLNVEGCNDVDDGCIQKLCVEHLLPHLKSLNVSHCDITEDSTISAFAVTTPQLEYLNIDGISWITDRAICDLCNSRAPQLLELILDGDQLTDVSICLVAKKCLRLKVLSISFSESLSDTCLDYIKLMENLTTLVIRKALNVSDRSVRELFSFNKLRNLQCLDLSECATIRDEEVKAMVACIGATLRRLSLNWCWKITDQGLKMIIEGCKLMEELELQGLKKIQGHCFLSIPAKQTHLVYLGLCSCNAIIDDLLFQIVTSKQDLIVINYYGETIKWSNGHVVTDY